MCPTNHGQPDSQIRILIHAKRIERTTFGLFSTAPEGMFGDYFCSEVSPRHHCIIIDSEWCRHEYIGDVIMHKYRHPQYFGVLI